MHRFLTPRRMSAACLAVALVTVWWVPLCPAPQPDKPEKLQINNVTWQQTLARLTPGQLYTEVSQVILNPQARTVDIQGLIELQRSGMAVAGVLPVRQSLLVIWPQIVGLVAMTVVCFGAAYVIFMRQEVRA